MSTPPEWDLLLSASQKNNVQDIKHLISTLKVNPGHGNALGQSALHVACLWGNVEAVETLLSLNAPPTLQNRITNGTPLHCAVQSMKPPLKRRVDCVQLLCTEIQKQNSSGQYTKVVVVDRYGCTPLDYVEEMLEEKDVVSGDDDDDDEEWMRLRDILVQHERCEEEEEVKDEQVKLLWGCIQEYNVEGVRVCLEQASSTTDEDDDDEAATTNTSKLQRLVQHVDTASGCTALLYAVQTFISLYEETKHSKEEEEAASMVHMIQYLLQYNSNPFVIPKGSTKISMKERQFLDNITTPKIDEDLTKVQDDCQIDMLHQVCTILSSCYKSFSSSSNDSTQKQSIDNLETVAKLLYHHRCQYHHHHHSLDQQQQQQNKNRNKLLLHMETQYLLHEACRRNNLRMVQFCISDLCIDINLTKRQGLTPLHFASRSGHLEIVQFLTSFRDGGGGEGVGEGREKVDLEAKDDGGRTALDMARINGRDDVVVLLENTMLPLSL